MPKYPLNLCPKSQRHTYTILRSYYPPELILLTIFYPFSSYESLSCRPNVVDFFFKLVLRRPKRVESYLYNKFRVVIGP